VTIRAAVIAVVTCLAATPAQADGEGPALSYQRLYFRAGIVYLAPLSSSSELELSGVEGPATLAVMDGPVAGSGVALDPVTIPAVTIGYRLPFGGDRFSVETMLGLPFRITFRATGTLADTSLAPYALDNIPTGIPPLGSELGEAEAAPPQVTVVYRIADLGLIRPYVGTGAAMLVSYNARATNPLLTEVGEPTFDVDPAVGWVLQSGIDVSLWWRIWLRVDVKYVAFMRAHTTVRDLEVRTPELPLLETARVGTATMDVWINPLVLQAGAGLDF